MAYQVEYKLKRRLRAAGITLVDLAQVLVEPPGTIGNRLNGYLELAEPQRREIEAAILRREEMIKEEEHG